MKRLLAVVGALVFACAFTVRAAGPEDQYLAVYYLIQQGDSASAAGNNTEAAGRYNDALAALQKLQRIYPQWQNNVVNFRLGYLQKRIAAVGGTVSPAEKPVGPAPANAESSAQASEMQAQMAALQASNASLQAKLREALAVRPAAVDPAQLARAEEQIKELSKQNELLKVSLDDAQAKAAATASAKQVAQLRQQVEEANARLVAETARAKALLREKGDLEDRLSKVATSPRDSSTSRTAQRKLDEVEQRLIEQQTLASQLARERTTLVARLSALETEAASAAALRAENELLKRQVADLRAAAPAPDNANNLSSRLAAAEMQIAALQSERDILRLERSALENRVKQLMVAAKSTTPVQAAPQTEEARRIKQLESRVETLQRQLAVANREAGGKGSDGAARADDLAAQVAALRARIQVYEAKPVPYLPEELALFRQSPARLASNDQPVRRSTSIPRPPKGMESLVVEAQRLFARGEFAPAEEKYQQVLRQDDKNVYTLANLGAIQLEQGKFDDAEKNLRRALSLAPDDVYSLQTLGYLKFRQEKYDDALTFLSQAAQFSPDSAEIQNYLGVTLSHKGQRAAAESALRKAVQLEPGYASAHNNLAVIYATQEPPLVELARYHYQKALAAGHPKNSELEKLFEKKSATPNP